MSVGTGAFAEIKVPPKVGWDGVVAQILDSATDGKWRINVCHFQLKLFLIFSQP